MPRASKAAKAATKKAVPAKKGAATVKKAGPAKKAPAKKAAAPAKKAPPSAKKAAAPAKKAPAKKAPPARKAAPAAKRAPSPPAKRAPAEKAPAARKTSAATDKFFQDQKALLLEERATYTRQAESLKAEADQLAEEREPGDVQFDEESGEGDTLAVERERDLALSAQARAAVEDIDRALEKIDAGTYGICEQCGDPIPRERLRALPYASLCVKCKSGGLGRR